MNFKAVSTLVLFAGFSVSCAPLEFKGSGPGKSDKSQTTVKSENAAATVDNKTSAMAAEEADTSSEELARLISASGDGVKRTTGDMGIKPGCVPNRSTSSSTVQVPGPATGGGWGSMPSSSSVTITNTVIDASACVADRLKTEPFAFCQLKTAGGELVECTNWSSVGGASKKSSATDCKKQADSSSGITTDANGQRSEPKKSFFFVCQKL